MRETERERNSWFIDSFILAKCTKLMVKVKIVPVLNEVPHHEDISFV
jgi:hypothetical protein